MLVKPYGDLLLVELLLDIVTVDCDETVCETETVECRVSATAAATWSGES